MARSRLKLGSHVQDPVTGIQGIITARTDVLHGVPLVLIEFAQAGEPKEKWLPEKRMTSLEPGSVRNPDERTDEERAGEAASDAAAAGGTVS